MPVSIINFIYRYYHNNNINKKKKRMKFLKILAVVLTAALFTACSDKGDEPEPVPVDPIYNAWYNVTSVRNLTLNQYCDLIIRDAVPESAQSMAQMIMLVVKSKLPKDMMFSIINFNYKSDDGISEEGILSGQVVIPTLNGSLISNKMVVDNRFTVLNNAEVPTNKMNVGAVAALTGSPVVTCDMLGYGSSISRVLNYHCHHYSSRNTVDAALAAETILHSQQMNLNLNNKILSVYNAGYSQGGFGALSFLKYMQEEATDEEKELLPVIKTVCGAGAYDIDVMFENIVDDADNMYPYYGYLAAALITSTHYHADVYGGLSVEDLFTEKAKASGLIQMTNSKQYGTDDISEAFATAMDNDYRPGQVFVPSLADHNGELRKTVRKAAALESLVTGWTPKTPIHFYHARNDEAVTAKCADAARNAFGSGVNNNITYDIDSDVTGIMGIPVKDMPPHMLGYFNFVLGVVFQDLLDYAGPTVGAIVRPDVTI